MNTLTNILTSRISLSILSVIGWSIVHLMGVQLLKRDNLDIMMTIYVFGCQSLIMYALLRTSLYDMMQHHGLRGGLTTLGVSMLVTGMVWIMTLQVL